MNIQEAKNIRLVDFLVRIRIQTGKYSVGTSVWYKYALQDGKGKPLSKVDLHKELWYDFGSGEGRGRL